MCRVVARVRELTKEVRDDFLRPYHINLSVISCAGAKPSVINAYMMMGALNTHDSALARGPLIASSVVPLLRLAWFATV
jgi:hypothetical protein